MSLEASGISVSGHRRSFSDLLAAHRAKRQRRESEAELQEAAIQLLNQHQNLSDLLLEVSPTHTKGSTSVSKPQMETCVGCPTPRATPSSGAGPPFDLEGSLIVQALQKQAEELGVPVGVVSAKIAAERVGDLMGHAASRGEGALLTPTQRVQLSMLVLSIQELLSYRAFSPRIFCRELWTLQPTLEVAWHLHSGNILPLENILESEDGVVPWLGVELRALCRGASVGVEGNKELQQQVLTGVVSALVRVGFQDPPKNISRLCLAVLDDTLSWVLEAGDLRSGTEVGTSWVRVLDATLDGACLSDEVLRGFFTHSLTHVLTFRPRFKVSDAVASQSEWSFAKSSCSLTALYRKLSVPFSVDEMLTRLRKVLETHEVNWQHILSCVSTVLVYDPQAQHTLTELLSQLLNTAFESYDLENMITAFLLARQGALEGPAVFPSYSEWFKMSFGSAGSYHGNSKKSVVFLLKFLSDLVPFEPPQYLKVHILHPPYVPAKHRALLLEYVSLAKTRLADLKVSVDEMGLYEDSSRAEAPVQPGCQAQQDVEKAVRLFENTGKVSAAVMEASIFRRQYFLTRFLPALLTPHACLDKPEAHSSFIESLRKAEKIPPSMYITYTQSCQRDRLQRSATVGVLELLQPRERLEAELRGLGKLLSAPGNEQEVAPQLARISETLAVLVPDQPGEIRVQTTVSFHQDGLVPLDPENQVADVILRGFCQSLMDASRLSPPNRQGPWGTQFLRMLLGHRELMRCLLLRLRGLICKQGASLEASHVLGLAAFLVQLHKCKTQCPLVLPGPGQPPIPIPCSEALGAAFPCSTDAEMGFSLRLCTASVSYALCCDAPSTELLQEGVPSSLCKKLSYLVPRLLPGARAEPPPEGAEPSEVWRTVAEPSASWESLVWVLWRQPHVCALRRLPGYQLSFAEWLEAELRVQRSRDALSDSERMEYQQWACQQHYLPAPLDQGGCDGDARHFCADVLRAILDFHSGSVPPPAGFTRFKPSSGPLRTRHGAPDADTCLPDIVARLQELMCEIELTRAASGSEENDMVFLLDLVSQRCLATADRRALGGQLDLEQTLCSWRKVAVALPASALVTVRTHGGRKYLDCRNFIEHVNQIQRNVCDSASRLPFALTTHFFKGVLSGSLRCGSPALAVDELLVQMPSQCPLLVVSAGGWWSQLYPVLASLWTRLTGSRLPQELQRLADCHNWACSSVRGEAVATPAAQPLLLAACLYHAGRGLGRAWRIRTTLGQLQELQEQRRLLLVFLLFFCVTDLLSVLIEDQEAESATQVQELCVEVLRHLSDSSDWLLLFNSSGAELREYQTVPMLTTDRNTRLMPLAFYNLVPQLGAEVLETMTGSPTFLITALRSYSALTKLFSEGHVPLSDRSLAHPQRTLVEAQQVLLRIISLSSRVSVSRTQLTALRADLDPEVAAALSSHLLYPLHGHAPHEDPEFL